jgi:hypothetical protein
VVSIGEDVGPDVVVTFGEDAGPGMGIAVEEPVVWPAHAAVLQFYLRHSALNRLALLALLPFDRSPGT